MELQLSIAYIIPNESSIKPFFWIDTTIIEGLVGKFLNQDVLNINYFSDYDNFESTEKIESVNSYYRNFISKSKDKSCLFYLTQEKSIDSNYIKFYCSSSLININLFVDLQLNSKQFLILRELALDIYNDYRDRFLFGPSFNICVRNLNYIRYRPERDYMGLEHDAILNFIHPPYYSSVHNLIHREDTKLLELELPNSVKLTEHTGLYAIQWVENLESKKQIQEALMNREDIIYRSLNLEPMFNFNEHGDKEIFHISALPKAPIEETFFNFYDPRTGNAFKLITLNGDMELDPEVVEKIKVYVKNKTSKTGDPFNKIVLITPSRETAVKAEQQARSLGVHKALYLDNNANVWDMRPLGEWRN